ncbi:glycoside hydrolase superfamily [Paraphoma chrysanthemicola]|uniref:alpha-galactosidase n=1 Tax=Paraphoma chrysanthemicola TaxID=798071 RepID=A0A8K0R4H4_9PLEO|nr:glycoside hydrolase superfamily [Paraphoma chrysanthemicola]
MSTKPTPKRPWSLRRKLLLGGLIALIVLALALGLGLGLTLGGSDDNDNDSPTLTPLPSPNTTLTWTPKVGDSWQIVLSHPPAISSTPSTTPNVTIFDVDLFDTPKATIDSLHALGRKVICYFSAGSYEEWRTDAQDFKPDDLGKELDGWPGEKWVRLGSQNLRGIMKRRIEMAREKGCDGVDPDNVDGYQNDNGLSLTANDSIAFMQYLSSVTRPLNMSMGLKNAGSIISAVLPLVDFSVNEQCIQYNECSKFAAFIDAGKPVFHIEYPAGDGDLQQSVESNGFSEDTRKKFCNGEGSKGFSTVLKKMSLDGWVEYCDGRVEVTGIDSGTGGHGKPRKVR